MWLSPNLSIVLFETFVTYEAVVRNNFLGVGSGNSGNSTERLGQAAGSEAVNIGLFLSDLHTNVYI
jgi:hypothetical protein